MQKPTYNLLRVKLSIVSTCWSQFTQLSAASFYSFPFRNTIVTLPLSISLCIKKRVCTRWVILFLTFKVFPSITPSAWAEITSIPKSWTNPTESTPSWNLLFYFSARSLPVGKCWPSSMGLNYPNPDAAANLSPWRSICFLVLLMNRLSFRHNSLLLYK